MKVFEGTFLKKDGTSRTMRFVKIGDLPKAFIDSKTKGGVGPTLNEGLENVWDVENAGFRVFNYNTLQGELSVFEETEDLLK